MMEVCRKEYLTTKKKFPVGIDVPEILADLGMAEDSTEVLK